MTSCGGSFSSTKTTKKEFGIEALEHTRNPKDVKIVIKKIKQNLQEYKGKTFEDIFYTIYTTYKIHQKIGLLIIYDLSIAICYFHNIIIDKVYIIGNGPKRAIKLLNIKTKTHNTNNIKLKYVYISDIINAFNRNNYELEVEGGKNNKNADVWESYLCNWQKTQ